MLVLDYNGGKEYLQTTFQLTYEEGSELFVICRPNDMPSLRDVFDLDESTIIDCMDIDESVRFTAFNSYDFASLVHTEVTDDAIQLYEINLYISRQYMILVLPENNSPKLAVLEEKILESARVFLKHRHSKGSVIEHLDQLLFLTFNMLIVNFSDTLELLEDRMQELSEEITNKIENDHFERIQSLRRLAYSLKKILRALSYIGLQMLCNENEVLVKKKLFLFRNLDTRFRKLYDFSENVYGLSTELLNTYDSKITQRTNDIVNKLTFITLVFAPLTLITGIYGMNFHFMPELHLPWAYPATLMGMLVISIGIYCLLKWKKWI